MGIDAEKLDTEADAEYARLMGQPEPQAPATQDKPDGFEPPAEPATAAPEVPQPEATVTPEPVADPQQPPAPEGNENWQDKYNKAEESRKNAHALMTQATQKAADLERSNQDMQQQLATLQAQVNLLSQQSPQPQGAQPASQQGQTDQFQELREDYEELAPVFNTLDEAQKRNQALEQRLAAIEQQSQQQEQSSAQQQFWNEVKRTHPDVEQVSASADFKGWFMRQPPDIQEMSRVSPTGAAYVMSRYKQSAGLQTQAPTNTPPSKMQQAQQLTEPQVRSQSQPHTKGHTPRLTPEQIAALPQAEFEKNEAEYDAMMSYWLKQGGS